MARVTPVVEIEEEFALPNMLSKDPYPTPMQKARQHMLEALRALADYPCNKKNCGTVCLCARCHAREALKYYDPQWTPRRR